MGDPNVQVLPPIQIGGSGTLGIVNEDGQTDSPTTVQAGAWRDNGGQHDWASADVQDPDGHSTTIYFSDGDTVRDTQQGDELTVQAGIDGLEQDGVGVEFHDGPDGISAGIHGDSGDASAEWGDGGIEFRGTNDDGTSWSARVDSDGHVDGAVETNRHVHADGSSESESRTADGTVVSVATDSSGAVTSAGAVSPDGATSVGVSSDQGVHSGSASQTGHDGNTRSAESSHDTKSGDKKITTTDGQGNQQTATTNSDGQVDEVQGQSGSPTPEGDGGEGGSPLSLAALLTLQAMFKQGDVEPTEDQGPRLVVSPGKGSGAPSGDVDLDTSTAGLLVLLLELSGMNPGYLDPELVIDPHAHLSSAQVENTRRLAKGLAQHAASLVANQMLLYNVARVQGLVAGIRGSTT